MAFETRAQKISEGEKIEVYSTPQKALLVVDIQERITGKYSDSYYYVNQSESLIDSLNKAIDYSINNGFKVVYIKNQISNPLINVLNNSMAKGGPGVELDSRLHIVSENIFSKSRLDAFSNSTLDKFLIENQIDDLYFTGLDAAFCVNSTIKASLNRNYKVNIINDALISESDSLKQLMLKEFELNGIKILSMHQFMQIK